jgi:hypothetical protein
MELAGYNSMDEIRPYTFKSSDLFHAKQNGMHDSSFAKINTVTTKISTTDDLTNSFFSDPPLERLQKLRIKLRFHNGLPVELGNKNFTCVVAFNLLRPDIIRKYNAQRPPVF